MRCGRRSANSFRINGQPLGFLASPQYGDLMTTTEAVLLETLRDLEVKARSMPTANPRPNLLLLFARLDELTAQLPRGTDADLLHYMHKKSYEKARLWLEGRAAENQRGTCGH